MLGYMKKKSIKGKAIFLDRDGVINREREDFTYRLEDFEILKDVPEALKILQKKGYLLIVITNQSGIGKGLYKKEDVERIHHYMESELGKEGIHFDAIYYCYHHPESGNCICRKPDSLFVEKGLARFNLNPELCWFIGDKERDVLAGKKAGVEGILIESNTSILGISRKL
jgi:D-glycero-D-manno-heptose 1,7-bisphosphate phosphatase